MPASLNRLSAGYTIRLPTGTAYRRNWGYRDGSLTGVTAMKLLSKRQLKELVLYSPQHIQRLEDAGRFPKRVRLGNCPRSRVGWIESEVLDWLRERIERRDTSHA